MNEVNERLFLLRKTLQKSRRAFGEPLAYSDSMIKNLDECKTNPKPEFLALVCKIYNVNYAWLTTGEGEMFMPTSEEQEIESIFTNAQCEDPRKYKLLKVLARAISELPDEAIAAICEYAKEIADAAEETDSPDE